MNAPVKSRPPTYVVTGIGRASYVNVFSPRVNDLNGKEEFSMAFLIPKTETKTLADLRAAATAALDAKWPDKAKRPANMRSPFRDGDVEKPADPAYAGHFWINVKSNEKPTVLDRSAREVLDAREFVSGDYCRISVNASAYDQKGNRGVSFWLNNVQVVRKGEPLSAARRRAEDEFTPMETEDGEQAEADNPW